MTNLYFQRFIPKRSEYISFFTLLSATFFMWGFLTCNNTILIPHVMNIFQLSFLQAQMLNFSFFGTYLIMSAPMGKLVNKIGYKNSMIVGLIIAGYACTLFGPASTIRSYSLFLLAMVVMASGITLLQVAANPYVVLLSDYTQSASKLTLKQGFNALGTTLAPILGSFVFYFMSFTAEEMSLMSPADYRKAEAEIVQIPYLGLAAIMFMLAFAMFFSKIPNLETHQAEPEVKKGKGTLKYVLQIPHLYLGVIAIFLYVGAEVGIGTFLVNVLVSPTLGGEDFYEAPQYVTLYWAGAMVGRFVGYFFLPKIETGKAVAIAAIISALLVLCFIYGSGMFAVSLLISVGLFNSILFPCIFTLGVERLGKFSEEGSSLLVMGIAGGAIIPLMMGALINEIGLQKIFFIPLLCYVVIIFYGLAGSRINKE